MIKRRLRAWNVIKEIIIKEKLNPSSPSPSHTITIFFFFFFFVFRSEELHPSRADRHRKLRVFSLSYISSRKSEEAFPLRSVGTYSCCFCKIFFPAFSDGVWIEAFLSSPGSRHVDSVSPKVRSPEKVLVLSFSLHSFGIFSEN